ncbi:MAG: hypothetical protein ABSF70_15120 [Terracidiphilus sp.]|jgi:5-methylcytosine-specific restriction endonuclease McrA
MKKKSIKSHLSPYSICQKRKTTINHAFASAVAPVDSYDEERLDAALRLLGQNPDEELECVYCGARAETWDHLYGLVKAAKLSGYGHQLGNLVPCCKACNSKKGAKDWEIYLKEIVLGAPTFDEKCKLIIAYRDRYIDCVNSRQSELESLNDWERYVEIKNKIFDLMRDADIIAKRLREVGANGLPVA